VEKSALFSTAFPPRRAHNCRRAHRARGLRWNVAIVSPPCDCCLQSRCEPVRPWRKRRLIRCLTNCARSGAKGGILRCARRVLTLDDQPRDRERSRIPVILSGGLRGEVGSRRSRRCVPWGVIPFTHTDVCWQSRTRSIRCECASITSTGGRGSHIRC